MEDERKRINDLYKRSTIQYITRMIREVERKEAQNEVYVEYMKTWAENQVDGKALEAPLELESE